jgi:hypothetical protein
MTPRFCVAAIEPAAAGHHEGVAARGNAFIDRAVQTVRQYRDFGLLNDPYGEHDFGAFEQYSCSDMTLGNIGEKMAGEGSIKRWRAHPSTNVRSTPGDCRTQDRHLWRRQSATGRNRCAIARCAGVLC